MKWTKYIRIDEVLRGGEPRRSHQSSPLSPPWVTVVSNPPETSFLRYHLLLFTNPLKEFFFNVDLRGREAKNNLVSFPQRNFKFFPPDFPLFDDELPPDLIDEITTIHQLLFSFMTKFEQQRISQEDLREFRYDSFFVGTRVMRAILCKTTHPRLSIQEINLAQIHIDNTVIAIENFKGSCQESPSILEELKTHYDHLQNILEEWKAALDS